VITWLDRVIAPPAERPDPVPQKEAMQAVTRAAAFEPGSWTPERATKVTALFDELAPVWNERQQSVNRYEPLADALSRGGVSRGRCFEVGSGTGLATPMLSGHFDAVIGLDLSMEMLRRAPGVRVHGDANVLPFRDDAFDSAVLVNALLFPRELDRVVVPTGTVVWVNTRGADTPIHLPPEDVASALPGDWHGVAAEAALGVWAVLRRT
jgi:SAM-dependent methyltransferase